MALTHDRNMMIGEIYMMDFGGSGHEQHGLRPGVIVQNNTGNLHSPNIIAIPLTSSLKKRSMPTHVFLSAERTGLVKDSLALCENPERMSKSRVGKYITTLSPQDMGRIAVGIVLSTSVISFLSPEILKDLWIKANSLNRAVPTA